MNSWSYSLLLILWWFPRDIQDKILTFYAINIDFHDPSCLALQLIFHIWGTGFLCSSRGELTDGTSQRMQCCPSLWLCPSYFWLSGGSFPPPVGLFESSAPRNVPRQRCPSFFMFLWCPSLYQSQCFHTVVQVKPFDRARGGQGPGLSQRHNKYKSYLLNVYKYVRSIFHHCLCWD